MAQQDLPPITASVEIVEGPDTSGPAPPSVGMLNIGEAFLIPVERLQHDPQCQYACYFLLGQATESILKSYLYRFVPSILTESQLANWGHRLSVLWTQCNNHGADLGEIPLWLNVLEGLHAKPFVLRYGVHLNGFSAPNVAETAKSLRDLVDRFTA